MLITQNVYERVGREEKGSFLGRFHGLKMILVVCGIGLAVGIVVGNLVKQEYMSNAANFDILFLANIKNLEIDKIQLLFMIMGDRLKQYFLLWVFSITILWQPYLFGFCLYQGFLSGFLLMVTINLYGIKGILLSLSYCMPHYLVLLPVFFITMVRLNYLNRKIYRYSLNKTSSKWKLVKEFLPLFLIFAFVLFLGCVLKAYANVAIVKKVLTIF